MARFTALALLWVTRLGLFLGWRIFKLFGTDLRMRTVYETFLWLKALLKANLAQGSLEHGVSVHDLVRDCMIRRAEARAWEAHGATCDDVQSEWVLLNSTHAYEPHYVRLAYHAEYAPGHSTSMSISSERYAHTSSK